MIDEFQKLIGYNAQSLSVLASSKMSIDQVEEFTEAYKNLLIIGLNITCEAFRLTEDQQMALLTLIVVKSLEATKND